MILQTSNNNKNKNKRMVVLIILLFKFSKVGSLLILAAFMSFILPELNA